MANGNGVKSGSSDPRKWHPVWSIIVGSILGGSGSLGVVFSTPLGQQLARPNPYDSVQAEIDQAKFDARLIVLEKHVGPEHPDRRSDFDARITKNTIAVAVILSKLDGIDNKLNQLVESR